MINGELVYNSQKKNKFSENMDQLYSKDNFNIISNKQLDSFANIKQSVFRDQIKTKNKKEKYKIKIN